MAQLDSALTKEIERETGISTLPSEVRSTISEPEYVVRTWSHGTVRVAATERRMFIQTRPFVPEHSGIALLEHSFDRTRQASSLEGASHRWNPFRIIVYSALHFPDHIPNTDFEACVSCFEPSS